MSSKTPIRKARPRYLWATMVACAAMLALLVYWYQAGVRAHTESVSSALNQGTSAQPGVESAKSVLSVAKEDIQGREPASKTASAESTKNDPVEPPASPPPAMNYAEKYKGFGRPELAGAVGVLREKRFELQKRIINDREAAGQFVKVYTQPGQKHDYSKYAVPEADRRFPQTNSRVAFHVRGGGNRNYVEVSGIPPGEYPEFDALQDEEIWLNTLLATEGNN